MRTIIIAVLCASVFASARAAIWEFDLGGLQGEGLLGGNEVDSLPNSFASGKEVGHYEIPGIIYDDVAKALEFHVGWGSHETINGTQLSGPYVSSALYGPAGIDQNAARAIYSFDSSNGYISANDSNGRTGFIHARVQLVELEGYSVAQQQADLLMSRWYYNIVSTAYGTGEIRGQLMSPIPEPAEYATLSALILLAGAVLRRRQNSISPP